MSYYVVKKNGKEFKAETKAGAFEMYDCLGRSDVRIEHHFTDTDAVGEVREYVLAGSKMGRRTLKDGTLKYWIHFD